MATYNEELVKLKEILSSHPPAKIPPLEVLEQVQQEGLEFCLATYITNTYFEIKGLDKNSPKKGKSVWLAQEFFNSKMSASEVFRKGYPVNYNQTVLGLFYAMSQYPPKGETVNVYQTAFLINENRLPQKDLALVISTSVWRACRLCIDHAKQHPFFQSSKLPPQEIVYEWGSSLYKQMAREKKEKLAKKMVVNEEFLPQKGLKLDAHERNVEETDYDESYDEKRQKEEKEDSSSIKIINNPTKLYSTPEGGVPRVTTHPSQAPPHPAPPHHRNSQKYFTFKGRTPRKDFWPIVLPAILLQFLLYFIDEGGVFSTLCSLVIFLGLSPLYVRRLHDVGFGILGWFLCFIPLFHIFMLFVMMLDSKKGTNEFGPNPKDIKKAKSNLYHPQPINHIKASQDKVFVNNPPTSSVNQSKPSHPTPVQRHHHASHQASSPSTDTIPTILVSAVILLFLAYSLLFIAAGWIGLAEYWHWFWAIVATVLTLVFRFPLLTMIGAFMCAKNMWDWHWFFVVCFVFPGAIMIFLKAILVSLVGLAAVASNR